MGWGAGSDVLGCPCQEPLIVCREPPTLQHALMQAPACTIESFLPTLAKQPGLTIFTQIVRTLGKSTRVPVPEDGNTVFAPTDAAFVALLQATGKHLSSC